MRNNQENINPLFRQVLLVGVLLLMGISTGEAFENPYLYRGVRPLGMGGAFTAVADDYNAMFYNPAGLSQIESLEIGVFDPLVEFSQSSKDLIQDISDTDMNDTGEVADLLREYIGEHHHGRLALFPRVGIPLPLAGVMIGGIAQGEVDTSIRNPVWPNAHARAIVDMGVLAGAGLKLPILDIQGGVAMKIIRRKSLDEVYTPTEIASRDFDDIIDDDTHSGSGISLDLGLICPIPLIPIVDARVGVCVQNIPEMGFGDAIDLKTKVNTGIAVSKEIAGFTITGAYDYHDITNAYDEDDDAGKNVHMGVELKCPAILSLRLGVQQDYLTAGASADFGLFHLDLASYGEEIGTYGGQDKDQRFVGQMSFVW